MKQLLLAATVLALGVGSAAAQDQVYDWSGAYVGVQAGHGWGDAHDEFPSAPAAAASSNIDGGLIGLYGGWNWQFNNVVAGFDADINYSGINGVGFSLSTYQKTGVDWTAALRARIGYAIDKVLIYGAAGAAFAGVDVTDSTVAGKYAHTSDTLSGLTIGAGVEVAFTQNLTGRLDYRYSDYGRIAYSVPGGDGWVDVDAHIVAIGIAYKF